MRKWIALLLVLTLALAACGTDGEATEATTTDAAATDEATEAVTDEVTEEATEGTDATEDTEAAETEAVEVGEMTHFGYGTDVSLSRSKEAADDKGPSAGANATIAAVGFDADGKIVDVQIDVIQPAVNYTAEGEIDGEAAAEIPSKRDKGDEYGMKGASGIGKEWFEQMDAFQSWMLGKTVEEVTGLTVKEVDENHKAVPDVPELTSSVTISVESYQKVIQEAWDKKVEVEGATAVGASIDATAEKSKALENDVIQAQFDIPMAAVAVDDAGTVVHSFIDNGQVRVQFNADGTFVEQPNTDAPTKVELGADYNMVGASGIGKEWFEQAEAFAAWTVGKTKADIEGLAVVEKDEAHPAVPDDPELTSSVTISVEDYQAALAEAIDNAQSE